MWLVIPTRPNVDTAVRSVVARYYCSASEAVPWKGGFGVFLFTYMVPFPVYAVSLHRTRSVNMVALRRA